MEPLRIGVLGAARIAVVAIVDPAQLTGARLVAVAARDRDRAEAFAAEHGVERVLDSYADVLADPEVEAVYNPLANGLHGPWNLAALAAGKHVLTEKPSASDAGEAREVRDAAARAGVVFMEAFHYLYHPVARRLLEVLGSGEIGELRHVEVHMEIPPPPDGDPRWSLPLAGGALMDVGCYGIHLHRALGRFAGGAPRVTGAEGRERAGHPGVDEWVRAELAFPGGATGVVHSSMAAEELRMTRPARRQRRRGARRELRAPPPRRPRVGDGGRHRAGGAAGPAPVVRLPARGVRRRRPRRGAGAHRRGRRGGHRRADRRLLPGGRVRSAPADGPDHLIPAGPDRVTRRAGCRIVGW